MRKLQADVIPGLYLTGSDGEVSAEELEDQLEELGDELVELGAHVTERGNVREDFVKFYNALKHQHEDADATIHEVIQAYEEPELDARLASLQAISSGRRVCRALVGVDNRIGLLAELSVANILENKEGFGPYNFFHRMQVIAQHAQKIDGQETFQPFLEEEIQASGNHIPTLAHIASIAYVNAVCSVCNAIIEQAPEPVEELTKVFPLCEAVANQVRVMSDQLPDSEFRVMVASLPVFIAIADAKVSQSNDQLDSLLNRLGVQECYRILRCAHDHEHYLALTNALEDAILIHYAEA